MIKASDIQIGQTITAGYWFERPFLGDDFATITGTVIKKLECYNQVLVEVDMDKSENNSDRYVWVIIDKSIVSINK